ncbi:hypothetical protein Tco_1494460, partial [Tanacetum coccineum]
DYFKEKMLLMQAQENGAGLDEEELLFLAGEQANTYDADVDDQPVLNLENAIDHHEIPNEAQQTNILDYDNVDMGYSNVIPYEQYVKHNEESVVPSGASSVQYGDYMLHENSAYVPDDSITTTLNIYKEQVAIYEQRAKFELTDREQKMDDQMRMLIQERNFREAKLKKELHFLQLQLNHTVYHKKIIQDSVNTLQQDFKQKK